MRISSFIGPNSTWAFTANETGSNLPAANGPWLKDKNYNMHRGQKLKMAVDCEWIIDAAEGGGYYLTALESDEKKWIPIIYNKSCEIIRV